MIRKILLKTALAGYSLLAIFIYAGFLLEGSKDPAFFTYSLYYSLFLVFFLLLLVSPFFLIYFQRRMGFKKLVKSLAPSLIFSLLIYMTISSYYYQTQTHPFDPFLQSPPPEVDLERLEQSVNEFRIVTIGGSTTLNRHLKEENRYPVMLESILREKHPDSEIGVLNAGMEWWTTKHSLINYVTKVRDWDPDLVIVMHGINDLYRSFSPEAYAMGEFDPSWSHFYGPAIGGANPPSYLGHLHRRYFRRILWRWYPGYRYIEVDYPVEHYVSREQFEGNLRKLIYYVRSDGVNLVLLTQPSILKEEMTKEERDILIMGFSFCMKRINWLKSEYPSPRSLYNAMNAFNNVTRRVAREEDVPLIELAEALPKSIEYYKDDVHYSPEGSEFVARFIADTLDNLGLLETSVVADEEER